MNISNKTIVFLLLTFQPLNYAFAKTYVKEFNRPDGNHKVEINISESMKDDVKNAQIVASEYVGDKKIWGLIDFVHDCPLDVNLNLISNSFEIKRINSTVEAVLFSYTIGCVGGIDPVPVKYFAYVNGVKHSLKGGERIVTPEGVIDDHIETVPDANLKSNKFLYEYMHQSWIRASTVTLN